MKKLLMIALSLTFVLASCGGGSAKKVITFVKPENYKETIDNSVEPNNVAEQPEASNVDSKHSNDVNLPSKVILGTWSGEMGGKTLTIVIEKVNGIELIGYNILGTNKRPVKGTYKDGEWAQSCSKAFDAILNEPGDDKWDGVFTVKFVGYGNTNNDTNECLGEEYKGTEAQGQWKSNSGKMKKEFNLTKK